MSDDLVKRLRNTGSMSHAEVWETFEEAADHIEELEAKLNKALETLDEARILEKALGSTMFVANHWFKEIHATIAELKGEDRG